MVVPLLELLDVNLPNGLLAALRERGITCDSAVSRDWRELTNGLLVEAAYKAGFRAILTRERVGGIPKHGVRRIPSCRVRTG